MRDLVSRWQRFAVPRSKHRRNGRTRQRGNIKVPLLPPLSPVDLEYERQKDALLMVELQKTYGGSNWGDWTDDQIDAALEQISKNV
jgi:hypothetical protein